MEELRMIPMIEEEQLRQYAYIYRMSEERITKKIYEIYKIPGKI